MTSDTALLASDVAVGGVLVAASLGRWRTTSGALLMASGGAWWLGDLVPAMTVLHRGFLVHLVLSHPGGRRAGPAVRVTVVSGYIYASVTSLAGSDVASLVVSCAVVAVAAHRHHLTQGLRRRSTAFALAAAGCLALALMVGPVCRTWGLATESSALAAYDLLVVAVALLVMVDVLRVGSARAAAAGLVVDLGQAAGSDALRSRLATRLGDPDLAVGYWLPSTGQYVDEAGEPVDPPSPGGVRTVTHLRSDGQPVAVLIHDSALLRDPRLLADVAAAAQWAVGNLALRAQVQQQVEGVAASRRRIVTAADAERARLEQRLRLGPGRRLQRIAALLSQDGPALWALTADVERAGAQLGDLARVLRPPELAEKGLRGALGELAARSLVPVVLEVPVIRLPAPDEVTLYFACAEALTNVLKYAHATQVQVRVTVTEQDVTLVVADDGAGGADPRLGTGLRGLADRAESLGGHLEVHSPLGAGTRVEVRLPRAPRPTPSPALVR